MFGDPDEGPGVGDFGDPDGEWELDYDEGGEMSVEEYDLAMSDVVDDALELDGVAVEDRGSYGDPL